MRDQAVRPLLNIALAVGFWAVAAAKGFDGWSVFMASIWTFNLIVVQLWHPWRPEPRWLQALWPSRDPDDYR